jgi:ketosteroid isomerase-like protein
MRGSGAAALALVGASVVVAFGCAGAPAPVELGDKRRPDGVAVDPMTRFGDVDDATRNSAGIAVLRTPPDDRTVRDAVGGFLDAVAREDVDRLRALFASDCQQIDSDRGARDNALNVWARRFARFDYSMSSSAVADLEQLRVFRREDVDTTWSEVSGTSVDRLDASDVVVVVPLQAQASRSGRLFGSRLSFLMRRADDRFVIYRIAEDFALTR